MRDEVKLCNDGLDRGGRNVLEVKQLLELNATAKVLATLEMACGRRFGSPRFEIRIDGTFLTFPARNDNLPLHESMSRISRWVEALGDYSTHQTPDTRAALGSIEAKLDETELKCLRLAAAKVSSAHRQELRSSVGGADFEINVPHQANVALAMSLSRGTSQRRLEDGQTVLNARIRTDILSTQGDAILLARSPITSRIRKGARLTLRIRRKTAEYGFLTRHEEDRDER